MGRAGSAAWPCDWPGRSPTPSSLYTSMMLQPWSPWPIWSSMTLSTVRVGCWVGLRAAACSHLRPPGTFGPSVKAEGSSIVISDAHRTVSIPYSCTPKPADVSGGGAEQWGRGEEEEEVVAEHADSAVGAATDLPA